MGRRAFTLIELMMVIAIIAIIAAIAIPNMLRARKMGNEISAIQSLRTVTTAEGLFREGDKEGDGNIDYGMLSELSSTQLIDSILGSGTKQGYAFEAGYSTIDASTLWFGTANPAVLQQTGDRCFSTSHTGAIYYTSTHTLSVNYGACTPDVTAIPVGK